MRSALALEKSTHEEFLMRSYSTVFSSGYRDYFGGSTPFGVIARANSCAPIIVLLWLKISPSGSG